jgi:phage-related protein
MMMLFRHKDISLESNYVVDMGRMHIYSNKRNLISQAVAEVAQPFNILQ